MARLRAGSIVNLHLGHVGTIEAISEIVAKARRRGLEPVTLAQLLTLQCSTRPNAASDEGHVTGAGWLEPDPKLVDR